MNIRTNKSRSNSNNTKNFAKKATQRRGATAVEFAMTVPILFLFVFGTFELGRGNMMKNTCESAAYEAARIAIVPGSTAAEAEEAARNVLATSGILNATVDIQPADLTVDTVSVVVTVEANFQANSLMPSNFLEGAAFESVCELNRERNR